VNVAAIKYDPLPAFRDYHRCTALEAALIGGYGSGKSRALVAEALKMGLQYPGSEHLITRKTIPSLRDTTESDFLDQIPKSLMDQCKLQKGGGHVQTLILPNESKYYFKGMDDWRKIKSLNLTGIWIDEADEFDEDTYDNLKSRLRQVTPRGSAEGWIRHRVIRLACNPAGKNWVWKKFVDKPTRNRVGFISTSLDNPYNPLSYIEDLLDMPEPWVRRYVFCSFEDFEGSIYPEWDWDTHVVKPYGQYDAKGWFWMGMDPGTHHPTAGVWAYWDPQLQKLVVVAEYAETGTSASHHVAAWRQIESHGTHNLSRRPGRMTVRRRIADPTIATRDRGSMTALETQYLREGFHFEHGPRQIKERLPMLGQLVHDQRIACTEECPQFYEQMKAYRYEDLTPVQRDRGVEAKPLKKNVDLVDAGQYIAARHVAPTRPERPPEPPPENSHEYSVGSHAELAARGVPQVDSWREQAADLVAGIQKPRHIDKRAELSRGL
jgi:PBSX family phage terminase large subunit